MNDLSSFFAITSYYNPGHFRRRLENFRQFRKALSIPLLVVDRRRGQVFELTKQDADILVQIPSTAVLWQKEQL